VHASFIIDVRTDQTLRARAAEPLASAFLLPLGDGGVERVAHVLDVVAGDAGDRLGAELWRDPDRPRRLVVPSAPHAADRGPVLEEAAEALLAGLATRRAFLLRLLGLARALRDEQRSLLAALVLALLQRQGVELRALAGRFAAGGRGVLVRDVDALARVVGQTDARAEVLRAVGAAEWFDGAGARGRHLYRFFRRPAPIESCAKKPAAVRRRVPAARPLVVLLVTGPHHPPRFVPGEGFGYIVLRALCRRPGTAEGTARGHS
jgi:hypothetical protein